jgi:hypothetical protein
VRPRRAVGRELQHPRPQRREHRRRPLARSDRFEHGGIHVVEVLHHPRIGLGVVVLAHTIDEMVVTHADAQQETSRKGFLERAMRVGHRDRVARVDVGDAGGDP